ncbi:uncharacterized protein LOC116293842 isoform X2 [Actinia tenebrosa]|uniref:Uncharacterized protein LOC116293842 isoform X2 n=1 Tax=Actinia tenebrosa TaxID=6105 RepID=A0A6P8HQ19_ACTTE|nr:uncharacterized protein LOC116293842 isoform X2 [Actinia tenebrosa]
MERSMDFSNSPPCTCRLFNQSHFSKMEQLLLMASALSSYLSSIIIGLPLSKASYLNENNITKIESGSFQDLKNLQHLWLHINKILDLPRKLLWGMTKLKVLGLNSNNVTKIDQFLFRDAVSLEYLLFQYNLLTTIANNSFANVSHLRYLFLDDNKLTSMNQYTLKGASALEIISLSNNEKFGEVSKGTFGYINFPRLRLVYVLNTQMVQIKMETFEGHSKVGVVIAPTQDTFPVIAQNDTRLQYGLGRDGFICNGSICSPCHFGEYQDRVNESYICRKCPPGGFFQNAVGHYGKIAGLTGCKYCARGTYVNVTSAPALIRFTCKVCPAGTKTDDWSNYRGCFCIQNFYRKHRFGECEACKKGGIRGVLCNETQMVKEGYWWQFKSYNESWRYQFFLDTLMEPYENYDHRYLGFEGDFPKAYPCPRAASCLGLLQSVRKPCESGYGGPLCEVCERGFHKSMSRCVKCPTLKWLIVQVSFVAVIILVIILILLRDERKEKNKRRTLTDVVLARLKIVIGFYQVTSGTLDAFSYVEWPDAMLQLSNYAKFLQLNLVQIAPLHCFTDSLKMNAYSALTLSVGTNVGVVLICFIYFHLKRLCIIFLSKKSEEEKMDDIHYSKSNCYRSAFLLLFVTFPETCSRILAILPPACMRLCQDRNEQNCTSYLKADYNLNCFDDQYNKYVKYAYFGSVYPILFPLFTILILYLFYYRKYIKPGAPPPQQEQKHLAIVDGMKFVYENYSPKCWYWEIVEMLRKLILTSGLSLIGSEGRTYIGMAAMGSGFYAVAHAQARPIPDNFEHLLQLASLVATFFNLSVGVLLRIPKVMENYSIQEDRDSVGVTVILVMANVTVTGLLVARYMFSLSQSIISVIKNPQCTWECCIGVVLSVQETGTDLSEIGETAATNDYKVDLQHTDTMGNGVEDVDVLEMGIDNKGAEEEEEVKAKENIYDNESYTSSEGGKKSPEGAESDKDSYEENPGERQEPIGEEQLKEPSVPLAQDMGDRDRKSPNEGIVNEGMEGERPETLDPYDVELKMAGDEQQAHVNIAIEDESVEETKF